jgi:signal transduction histidine kinase
LVCTFFSKNSIRFCFSSAWRRGRSVVWKAAAPFSKIEFEREPSLPNVEHDRDQIYQLLLNLLLNAAQAIDGAGAIRVETALLKDDASITVVDTGRGIAPEHLPNIFRPFYTTKANGTGLGLSLARRIAVEHHGRIEVTSEVGKGTKFLVVLPLQQLLA